MTAPSSAAERSSTWPADADAIVTAAAFLDACAGERVAIACDSDVDGLTAAVIVERALGRAGAAVDVLPARRGEHVHRDSMRERIRETGASRLVVLDMGSRPEPILPGMPTLVIDHHHAAPGMPPGAIVVNGHDRPPVATTSVLAFVVSGGRTGAPDAWLAALGAVADLGSPASFRELLGIRTGGAAWKGATALLNAARRAPHPDPSIALSLLRRAQSVQDVTSGAFLETARLEAMRERVRIETDRCSRIAPRISGDVALIPFSSGAQVHPLVAVRWAPRLRPRIVIAANDGYLPDRTNFAIRCQDPSRNLIAWLRSLPFTPGEDAEYANGHARATGGSLSPGDFDHFIRVLGFT